MSNVQSYNALIDRFKAFASGHFILKSFSHGQIDTADLEKFTEYPFMHVVPSNVTYAKGTKTFSFQIVLADLPRDKDDKVEFQREVLSDLQRIAEDLVAEITNHRVLFGDLITVQNVSLEPFLEEFHNTLTGWTVSLDLFVPYYWDACSIPAEWNDMFESGSGGTGSILTFIDSITRDENGNVSLVNDEATPAPNYYYGTNDEGVRGWYLLTDEVGLTCATIGTCQTIIDIEAEIDLLQQDVTDLQADIVAIETELPNKVPYTGATANVDLGEYELKAGQIEFDTTPTGTAGAAVMRWNDTDGTVDVGLKGGNVTLQVGQESVVRVVNKAGADLLEANYQAVRVRLVSEGGAQGQRLAVVLALADTDADSATTIGLVTETINNNQEGFVTTSGEVRGINTTGSLQGETWVDGDILYLSGTTAGRVTNVKPAAPTHTIIIGYVVYAHANNGKIFVKVDNGYELDELHNVSITSPTDNQALVYESASSLWKNETIDKTFVGLGNVDNTSDANKPISTATQTALNAKQDSLGFTPVPETRTLTINGTTQDLSANRTFTIATGLTVGTTPITSGTVGRVLFEGTGNVLQESANFFWDNTNSRLGIGTASPTARFEVSQPTSGVTILGRFLHAFQGNYVDITGGASGAGSIAGYQNASTKRWEITATGDITLNHPSSIPTISAQGQLRLSGTSTVSVSSGNFLIGTTTDAGFKLDVNGTARILNNLTVGNSASLWRINFDVTSGSNPGGYLNWTFSDNFTYYRQYNQSAFHNYETTSASGYGHRFISQGAVSLTIRSNGNVLIGTTTDAGFKLDVNGTARVSGIFTCSNQVRGTSLAINDSTVLSESSQTLILGAASWYTLLRVVKPTIFNGTSINASAQVQIDSTTQGFLPPRMTTTQKNAIATPAAGLVVYDTTLNKLCVYTTAWETITSV